MPAMPLTIYASLDAKTMGLLNGIVTTLASVHRAQAHNHEETMAAIDDLNAAVTALQTEQTAIVNAVTGATGTLKTLQGQVATLTAELANNPTSEQIEAAATALQSVNTGLAASVDALNAAITPPAA